MKIGILTYHRAHNYGALLQAIAMRLALEGLGHEAYYVDYFPEYHQRLYRPFSKDEFNYGGLRYKIGYMLSYQSRKHRSDVFKRFVDQMVAPYCKSMNEDFDAIIYGSDQIWRKQPFMGDYNPIYFSHNDLRARKHIAYAASMGNIYLSPADRERIAGWLKGFDAIGIREDELLNLVHELGQRAAVKTSDPTLLLPKSKWDEIISDKRIVSQPYLLLYELRNGFDEKAVRDYASRHGLQVIKIAEPKTTTPKNARLYDNPYEFVNLIRHADFICTSSFHGLVFSIIYGKPFYTAFASNADRAASLLNMLGLSSYLLPSHMSELPLYEPYENEKVVEKLAELRSQSIEFLQNTIKTEK